MQESYKKFLSRFLVIVLAVAGVYFVWDRFFSEAGKARRFVAEQTRVYEEKERAYIEAMTADTYGGKTPQETLDLFVAALEKGDIELASKYFLLDENLSREKWVAYLKGVKDKDLLAVMARDIRNLAKPVNGDNENDFAFEILNNKGLVSVLIDMQFNKHSQVWKIESL
jgi:hypothetical protein